MRKLIGISMVILIGITTFATTNTVYAAPFNVDAVNLLLNGGFEEGNYSPTGTPDHWSRDIPDPSATLLWDDSQSQEGNRSIKISAPTPNDVRWVQIINVQPHTNYLLSGWIKTENVGHTLQSVDMGATLSLLGTWDQHSIGLFGTNDWTYVSFAFGSGEQTQLAIAARLGFWSGTTTGTAWFDDIQLTPIRSTDPHPGWKILVLIYDTVDFTYTDSSGITHHYFTVMTQEEMDQAARTSTQFVEEDIPALTSGNMIPTITIRYPERSLTELTAFSAGWWPGPWNIAADLDPAFDSVIVIWDPWVVDEATSETTFIGGAAGLAPPLGTGQTYTAIIVDAATWYGHRNVFRHEWGHNITSFYDALGTSPKPGVNNHINATDTQYVHCPSGESYTLVDETPANPIPNSIYNLESGFTHDYYSGITATPDQPSRCLGITPEAWASGGPVSKPIRPLSLTQQIDLIRDQVNRLVLAGDLAESRARLLYGKLDAASTALQEEQTKKAGKSLQLFINKVDALIKTERLPKAEGLILIEQTMALINQLDG